MFSFVNDWPATCKQIFNTRDWVVVEFGCLIYCEFYITNAQALQYQDDRHCPVCELYRGDDALTFQVLQLLLYLTSQGVEDWAGFTEVWLCSWLNYDLCLITV